MKNDKKHDDKDLDKSDRTVVAAFQTRAEAQSAIAALHKAHYTHTWLGTTSVAQAGGGDETLTVESTGILPDSHSLVEALVSHGVNGDVARDMQGSIAAGNALLTLDPKDKDPAEAVDIIEKHGGRLGGGVPVPDSGIRPRSVISSGTNQAADKGVDELVSTRH